MIGLAQCVESMKQVAGSGAPHAGGRPPYDFTKEQILAALTAAHGQVKRAATFLKCSRSVLYEYLKKYPDIDPRAIRAELIEDVKDFAEAYLFRGVRRGDMNDVKFFLARQAKDRGYATRQEVTGQDGSALQQDHKVYVKRYGFDPEQWNKPVSDQDSDEAADELVGPRTKK